MLFGECTVHHIQQGLYWSVGSVVARFFHRHIVRRAVGSILVIDLRDLHVAVEVGIIVEGGIGGHKTSLHRVHLDRILIEAA